MNDQTQNDKPNIALCDEWKKLDQKKTSLMNRCEDYAMWTLPYMFPRNTDNSHAEMQGALDSIGARATNHVSNKLVMTLFAPSQPFFRLMAQDEQIAQIKEAAEAGDGDAKQAMETLDKNLAQAERNAMRELDINRYRTEATNAAKSLVITGNALMYHPEKGQGKVQSYNLRDYCVVRDLSGTVIKIMTRDMKAFSTFSQEVQDALNADSEKKYQADTDVTLYTKIQLEDDGKFHLYQAANKTKLDSEGAWPPEDLPWIPLTWNLSRGEDYGRGLVEDYAGAFHALYVLSNAEVNVVGVAADIKFLVDPGSVIDVVELNNSESGSYHSGRIDDIHAIQLNKAVDMQMVESMIERLERQIAAAFLLNSGMTRDAERVTAEEIRTVANELEMAHGGIYSRFAEEWQYRVAVLMLKRVDIDLGDGTLYPQIITGLDSLSRAGDLDNLRLFVSDLAMLDAVPEEIRAAIDPSAFASYVGIRRGVDYAKFLKSQEQLAKEQEREQQMMQQQMAMQAGANIATEAGKAAVQGEE